MLLTREHDKGPDLLFHTLYQLADQGLQFKVSVLGETFSEVPGIFFHKIISNWINKNIVAENRTISTLFGFFLFKNYLPSRRYNKIRYASLFFSCPLLSPFRSSLVWFQVLLE